MKPEERIQISLFEYIGYQYPDVIAISEASGTRVSMGLAIKLKKMRTKGTHLDVYVLQPVGKYAGLVLELKAKSVFKKDGTLLKNEHVEDQQEMINRLNDKGYYATFACSLDEGIKIVDNYLNGNY